MKTWWAQDLCPEEARTPCCIPCTQTCPHHSPHAWHGPGNMNHELQDYHGGVYGHQQLVVHRLHHDLLRCVLTHIKPQLQLLDTCSLIFCYQRGFQALQGWMVCYSRSSNIHWSPAARQSGRPFLQSLRVTSQLQAWFLWKIFFMISFLREKIISFNIHAKQ